MVALPHFFADFSDDPESGSYGRASAGVGDSTAPDVPEPDRARVERIQAGDEAAYEELFVELFAPLREFCVTYVATAAVAEEIVQDVFLDLWMRRASWRPVGGIRAYLFRAVRNRALNDVRHARTAARVGAGQAEHWMGGPPPPPDAETPGAVLAAALAPVIASLPPARRRAALLRWRHGLDYAEIAEVMGTSVASVTKHIARAREAVRPLVERHLSI